MNIQDTVHFDNSGEAVRFPLLRRLFVPLVILLVAALSFGIGRLTAPQGRKGVNIEYAQIDQVPQVVSEATETSKPVDNSPSNSPRSLLGQFYRQQG